MTTPDASCRRAVRRRREIPILVHMRTPPRWLREHRRAARAAASPEWLAAEVARLVDLERRRPQELTIKPVDWDTFGDRTLSDEEWETFIAAIEELKGRPLVG